MCEDCIDEKCQCAHCYNYRHYSACPVCGHTIFLDCCQGFIMHKYDLDFKLDYDSK